MGVHVLHQRASSHRVHLFSASPAPGLVHPVQVLLIGEACRGDPRRRVFENDPLETVSDF